MNTYRSSFINFGLMLSLLMITKIGIAQSKPQQANSTVGTTTQDAQWEYLVVSYGKTIFGNPEKTLAYRSIGLSATAQEANEIQESLDVLGRFSWEVITVVGAIGGDQQIVLKRRYDKNRVANEGLAILRGRELYLKDLIDILERSRRIREESITASAAEKNKPRLIDLDAKEREEKKEQIITERQAKLNSILSLASWGKYSKALYRSIDAEGKYNSIEVTVDLSELMLTNGNSYRASEVKTWINSTALPLLRDTAISLGNSYGGGGSINISLIANINFNGKAEKVGEQKTYYSDALRRWN